MYSSMSLCLLFSIYFLSVSLCVVVALFVALSLCVFVCLCLRLSLFMSISFFLVCLCLVVSCCLSLFLSLSFSLFVSLCRYHNLLDIVVKARSEPYFLLNKYNRLTIGARCNAPTLHVTRFVKRLYFFSKKQGHTTFFVSLSLFVSLCLFVSLSFLCLYIVVGFCLFLYLSCWGYCV